jgi:ATP-dependent Lon protease
LLSKEIDVLTVQQEINTQARADIDRSQREYFLRQQLKAIQSELGEGNELFEEIEQYRDKILKAKMPKHAEEEALRQLKKLERMHPDTAETATLRNWLDIMTDLPWSKSSKDNLNLKKAEKILDEDHYGSGARQRKNRRSARRSQIKGKTERLDSVSRRTAGSR